MGEGTGYVTLDFLGFLFDKLTGGAISNLRGRSVAQQIAKLTQVTRTGQPVSATLPAALHAGEAVPPRPHAWKRGRLRITPSAVTWQRRGLLHGQSRDLTGAQYIQQREPDWSGTDRRLSAPGYLAPSIRVLALQASGEQIEITLPSQAIDALPAFTQRSRHHGTSQKPGSSRLGLGAASLRVVLPPGLGSAKPIACDARRAA